MQLKGETDEKGLHQVAQGAALAEPSKSDNRQPRTGPSASLHPHWSPNGQEDGTQSPLTGPRVPQWTPQWTPSERSSPEKYALDDDELSDFTE